MKNIYMITPIKLSLENKKKHPSKLRDVFFHNDLGK